MDTFLPIVFAALLLLQYMSTGVAVIFSQDSLNIWLPVDVAEGEVVARPRITLLKELSERKHIIKYSLQTVDKDANNATALLSTFQVDELTGVVRTRQKLCHLHPGTRYKMRLHAKLESANSSMHANMSIDINIVKINSSKCKQESELVCFGKDERIVFKVYENMMANQSIGLISQPAFRTFCQKEISITYRVEKSEFKGSSIALHATSGELVVLSTLDHENKTKLTFNITCDVTSVIGARKPESHRRKLTIYVADVNDNGPCLLNNSLCLVNNITETYFSDTDTLRVGNVLKTYLFVIDNDTIEPQYTVNIVHDPEQLFSVHQNAPFKQASQVWVIEAKLELMKKLVFAGDTYKVSVSFTDEGLPSWNSNRTVVSSMILTRKAVKPILDFGLSLPCNITPFHLEASLSYNVTIRSSAAIFSRVAHLFKENVTTCSGLEFWLTNVKPQSGLLPFNVTPQMGIIYVNSSLFIEDSTYEDTTYFIELHWKNKNESVFDEDFVKIQVYVQYTDILMYNSTTCEKMHYSEAMCAMHPTERNCEQNCGGGSSIGTCQWISSDVNDYSTCIADFNTCPDGICDELEALSFAPGMSICPQDCVRSNKVSGSVFGNRGGMGIKDVRGGTCTCDISSCTCIHDWGKRIYENRTKATSEDPTNDNATAQVSTQTEMVDMSEEPACGQQCIFLLILGLVFVAVITFCAVKTCRNRFRFRGWTKGRKYPGSSMSLPAVPSDYVDEHSPSVVSNSDTLSTSMSKLLVVDLKWEFPRDRLILEQTLGEGEFGRVVKAKALDISGMSGYVTVAVKMLKNGGTNSEQDLISEFNLLKEVSHPNVIRLLGACTSKGGPLYVIVEYAEYGSLRGYLRRSRRLEFKSCTSDDSGVDSIATSTHKETSESQLLCDYHLSQRDLVSFAWQISKGMAYLSEMKLVHRDLAARNVLVAAGKIVKISDFGLTRDIYVEDAYFKKSLGRVPVKWMAIESLVDNIYTTKSDVWSFGIVLWEIVTLGAGPYPGVPPERLYQLLKNGYRMENPDSSSEELYKIMLKCWTDNPQERPSFAELTIIFDRMLQENVDYLDLTMNVVHNLTYFQDIPRKTESDGEEVEESEEGEAGYGSWNAFASDDTDVGSQACNVLSNANTLAVPATALSVIPSRDSSASDYEDAFFLQPTTTSDLNLSVVVHNATAFGNCDVGNRACDEHAV